jgi:hypothetical protein
MEGQHPLGRNLYAASLDDNQQKNSGPNRIWVWMGCFLSEMGGLSASVAIHLLHGQLGHQ